MAKPRKKPAYVHHKPTGQARVRIGGKDFYLGEWKSPASIAKYEALVGEWLAKQGDVTAYTLTVDNLVLRYLNFARAYYVKNGALTTEVDCIRLALRLVVQMFGPELAKDFSPKKLKAVQEAAIRAGHLRGTINRNVHRIRRAFKWAVSEELIPPTVLEGLRAVPALRAGRTAARESAPIMPVAPAVVERTLPCLSPVVADMVRLQLLTGCRPGELVLMRPCDVDRTGDAWTYTPASHKMQHHGRDREVHIGPRGQLLLQRYLLRPADAYCFSPRESMQQHREARHEARKTPAHHGNGIGSNRKETPRHAPRERFDVNTYRRAITRACELAFDMPEHLRKIDRTLPKPEQKQLRKQAAEWREKNAWAPHRLRHLRATELREQFDIRTAQAVLGHNDVATTVIYAERSAERARAQAAIMAIG